MNETAHLTAPVPVAEQLPASQNGERGRTNGLPFIFWVLEQNIWALLSVPTVFALLVGALSGWSVLAIVLAWLAVPLFLVVLPLAYLVYRSHAHDAGAVDWRWAISWRDEADAKQWFGKKIPMEILYEAYIAGKLDFKNDVYETMLRRNQLFRFCFTWGDIKFYFKEFLTQNVTHSKRSDEADIAHVYNRGNDFYHWFLGDTMTYTSGIFNDPEESLETAQERKLELVCQYVHMQPGDQHLDIGCGWGPLITHAAKNHGTFSTGITLAQEQADWANARAAKAGVSDRVRVIVDDYRNLPAKKYDKITCLEMAEHVGIKNFQKFLLQVKSMLKDDGIFYLQIAGLRRPWQFEDLVWGLFMAKYIFPGADASCPLGFVVGHAERAGFEVHRVENTGTHYAVTIWKWYQNWKRNEAAIVAKYGQRWYRLWLMFLGWSVIIGGQGSSALFMITMTKNHKNDKSTVGPEEAQQQAFSRQKRWISRQPIATQR
jgi:cyclopropane fatty-acyl-phospholipid synthase-like methyltransferase